MSSLFHHRRRQAFLQEAYFAHWMEDSKASIATYVQHQRRTDFDANDQRRLTWAIADKTYQMLSQRYSAGEPVESLRTVLADVIEAYERFQAALAVYEEAPSIAPLGLGNIGDYERCMQLIGLCYLLHRRDLLPRLAALQDPAYIRTDALYEDLLRYGLTDRPDTDEMLHLEAYDPLLGAIWESSDVESAALLKQYVDNWYPHFKYVPWHDGHKRINGNDGDYFGYWAFEAGAVALLCDIDDSAIKHMVYPKDLVAWARRHKHLTPESATSDKARLRCDANQPCPREGYWFTPAKAGSRRWFKQGELMPGFKSDYGLTIWQWDEDQSA